MATNCVSLLGIRYSQRASRACSTPRWTRFRPHLEELEGRRLPSCTITIANSVLRVDCSNTGQNTVTVDHIGSTTLINNTGFADARFNSIVINGGTGGTTENLRATVKPLTVFNNALDTVNIGNLAGTVQGIQADVTLENIPSFSTINIDDRGDSTFRTVTFDSAIITGGDSAAGILTGLAPATIRYEYFDAHGVTVRTGTGGASVRVLSYDDNYNASNLTFIGNGAGTNMAIGTDVANTFAITGANAITLSSSTLRIPVAFSGFQNLMGGAANNTFTFNNGGSLDGNIVGGGGTNTLNYAALSGTSVIVDLATATATGVGGSVTNIQNAVGSSGGGANGLFNIFVGTGGNVFTGGNGRRNLMIAGASASNLTGGNDDDILIGVTTAYDTDIGSLTAIMAEWTRTDEDYTTRVDNLLSGTNAPLLDATTVTGNGGGNTLTGAGGHNLYYGSLTGDTTDRTADQFFIVV
jgi:hypothetical protein